MQDGKVRRPKNPAYRVYKQDGSNWVEITNEPIKASSRKDAVSQATEEHGTFMVLNSGQIWVGTRGVETVKQESWT